MIPTKVVEILRQSIDVFKYRSTVGQGGDNHICIIIDVLFHHTNVFQSYHNSILI
jgi:hypothetical protein